MRDLPELQSVDAETGEPANRAILEEAGVAYDPHAQHLDLSKDEKRRTTALMMAIQAYNNLIIKDAEYLKEMHNEARRENGPVIKPATMDAMVEAAIRFDLFISGRLEKMLGEDETIRGGAQTEAAPEDAA